MLKSWIISLIRICNFNVRARKKCVGNLIVVTGVSESPKYVDLALKLDIDETKRSLQVPRGAQKCPKMPKLPKCTQSTQWAQN